MNTPSPGLSPIPDVITNTGPILHLNFAEITAGKVTDASGFNLHGAVQGNPQLVPDDTFCSCLSLNGTSSYVALPAAVASDFLLGFTFEAWVFYTAFNNMSRIFDFGNGPNSDNLLLANLGTTGNLFMRVYNGAAFSELRVDGKLKLNEWMHLACTVSASGAVVLYVNGQQVGAGTGQALPGLTRHLNYLGKSHWAGDEYFRGKFAGTRVYNRVLSADEIRRDMADDQTAAAAFRASYPLYFRLYDYEENQQVIYITDYPEGRVLGFEVINTSRKSIVLAAPVGQVSAQNHHFELRLRPGTLSAKAFTKLALVGTGWSMTPPQVAPNGVVSLYFLSANALTFNPDDKITLKLSGIDAEPGAGARGTRVELRLRQMNYPGDPTPLTGTRIQHLSIVNHRGQKFIPLHVGLFDSSTVLNDGTSSNQLSLRITNVSRNTLPLTPGSDSTGSRFIISFDTRDNTETGKDWALGTASQVDSIQVNAAGWTLFKPVGLTPEWILTTAKTSLAPNEVVQVTLTGIISSLPSGLTNMYVRYENIPGHWDGQFVVPVEKAPILYRDNNVGVGINVPQTKLHVIDSGNTGLRVQTNASGGKVASFGGNGEFHIDAPGIVGGRLAVKENGNIGVGTFTPSTRLTVKESMNLTTNDRSPGAATRVFEGLVNYNQTRVMDIFSLNARCSAHLELLVMVHDLVWNTYRLYQKSEYACYREQTNAPKFDLITHSYRKFYTQDIYAVEMAVSGNIIQAKVSQRGVSTVYSFYQVVARYLMGAG